MVYIHTYIHNFNNHNLCVWNSDLWIYWDPPLTLKPTIVCMNYYPFPKYRKWLLNYLMGRFV